MPNTEVKLILAYDTWRATARENRCCRHLNGGEHTRSLSSYCLLAQSVEHMTVNHGVVSSSLTEAATKGPEGLALGPFFACTGLVAACPYILLAFAGDLI